MGMNQIKVELIDSMGSDLTTVNVARVSFDKESDYEYATPTDEDWEDYYNVDDMDIDEVMEAKGYTCSIIDGGRYAGETCYYKLRDSDAKLIVYLSSHRHTSPFRHNAIQLRCHAPIFLARQLGKHQAGLCLHEDTEVTVIRHHKGVANSKQTVTLKELYRMWSGQVKYQGGKKGKMNVQKRKVRVYNEETMRFETSTILDVIDSGVKEVFQVTDEAGNTIAASKDHDFLTVDGWKKLKNLQVGDYLIRDDIGESFGYSEELPRGLDKATRNKFRATADCCAKCGSKDELEVDHVISVAQDLSLATDTGNLQILCKKCHKEKSASERQAKTTLLPKMIPIVKIESLGEAQTYDLSIDKIHNFMGNGFVVHNSWNEVSRRYVDTPPEFFVPDEWRGRPDGSIKQGSGGEILNTELVESMYLAGVVKNNLKIYNEMLENDVAPEMARMVLPQSMMTSWYWTGNLLAFAHVYKERIAEGAQLEAQHFARELDKVVRPLFSVSWKALVGDAK